MMHLAYLHNHRAHVPWSDEFVKLLKPLCVTPFLHGRENQNTTGQLLRQEKPFTTWLLHFSFSISPVVFHKKTLEFLHKLSFVHNGTLLIPAWTKCSCGNTRYTFDATPRAFSRRQKQAGWVSRAWEDFLTIKIQRTPKCNITEPFTPDCYCKQPGPQKMQQRTNTAQRIQRWIRMLPNWNAKKLQMFFLPGFHSTLGKYSVH